MDVLKFAKPILNFLSVISGICLYFGLRSDELGYNLLGSLSVGGIAFCFIQLLYWLAIKEYEQASLH